jgi:hypothetical protein
MQGLESPNAQVLAVVRDRLATRVDRELPSLADLELEMERQGSGQDVVPGPEVGGGRRHADEAAANGHRLGKRSSLGITST